MVYPRFVQKDKQILSTVIMKAFSHEQLQEIANVLFFFHSATQDHEHGRFLNEEFASHLGKFLGSASIHQEIYDSCTAAIQTIEFDTRRMGRIGGG